MKDATTNSMKNLLVEKSEIFISAKVPARMRVLMNKAASKMNMNISQYIKLAISERLSKDFEDRY